MRTRFRIKRSITTTLPDVRIRFSALILSLSILLCLPVDLLAQTTTTMVLGTVQDSSGAPIALANVTATNRDTNFSRTVATNDQGEFRIYFLPVGSYRISANRSGFEEFLREGIGLSLNVATEMNIVLEVEAVRATVTITEGPALVDTTSAELGRTVENRELVNLPLMNRNAYQLLELTPGVQNTSFNPGQANPVVTLGYPEQRTFINGGVDGGVGSVSYYLDGGVNMTGLRNTGNILPSPDAIQEYRVETNNYGVEYGRMSGGVITVITKSGTNNFHGSAFEYWRDSALNANNWGSILPKAPLRRNQFGATMGGPVRRDKTFFFASYQGLRQVSSFFLTGGTVPTAAERTGNFTGLVSALPVQYTCGSITVVCPSLLDPVAQKLLNPLNANVSFPTIPSANVGATGWQGTSPSPFNADEFLIKIDHNLGANQRFGGSYFYTSGNNSVTPLNSNSGQPNGSIPWDAQRFTWRQQNLNLNDTWTVNPDLVTQAWFTYTRNFGGRVNLPATSLGDLGSDFTVEGTPSLPQIAVQGPIAFSAASAIGGPVAGTNFYSLRDMTSLNHGRHSISFGAEESLERDVQQTLLNNYGVFTLSNTNVADGASGKNIAVPGIALFLMGLPTAITQDSPVTGYTNTWNTGFFGQDRVRAFPRLTLTLGVRWDIATPPTDPADRGTSFQAGEQSIAIPQAPEGALFFGDPGVTRGIVPVRWHHVSPRVGLAWDPFGDGKTSLRAAAGVFYNSISGNEWNTVTNFEPSAIRFTFTNTTQSVKGSGLTAVPQGATLSCPYNFLSPKFLFGVTRTVTCPGNGGSGAGLSGNDPFPFAAPNFLTVGGPFFGVSKNFQWPYSYQLSLSLDRQITSNFGVSVAYVGALSHDLPFAQDLNAPSTGAAAPACATSSAANIVDRRPIDNPGGATCASLGSPFGTVYLLRSNQTASYNGLQVTAQMRMSHGLMLYSFYTFSHTFDSVQLDNNTTQGGAEDMTNLRLERGPADFDLRHQFVSSLVWQPNYYKGQNRLQAALLHAWAFSSIINIHSGFPFTIYNGSDANLTGNATAGTSGPTSGERAQLVPGQRPFLSDPKATEWFNTAAFKQIPATSGISIDGNSSRNMLRGPSFRDVDLAISRSFPINRFKEGAELQFRADAYNVFNMVSLSAPSGNAITAGSSTFGEILNANSMRQLQLGLRLSF
jgi:outer membrane receptor protein involved in Fe transport